MDPRPDDLLLPVGARVLHIGPHKTGTTTVQFAFHAARPALAAQRVFYPGPNSQPMFAVYAVTGRLPVYLKEAPVRRWQTLIASLDRSPADRAVISSEGFCDAEDDAIRRIADDIGPDRIHVVVTLRPLGALLASQWQQSVQDGRTLDYESWLQRVFREPGSTTAQAFWHRHRHDRLVERWARVVGPDRTTVVVVDERDHEAVLRVFEGFVGLAPGTLQAGHSRTNRSLTRSEIELVRAMNESFLAADVDPEVRVRFIRDGVGELLKHRAPGPDEPRIVTPEWARDAAAAVSREIVEGIAALGVRVVGSLERLAPAATGAGAKAAPASAAPVDGATAAQIAAAAPLAVVIMSGLARQRSRSLPRNGWPDAGHGLASAWLEPVRGLAVDVDSKTVSTAQIRRALVGRARRGIARRLPAVVDLLRKRRRSRDARVVQGSRAEVV